MLNKLYKSLIFYLSNLSQYKSFMVNMNMQFINTRLSVYIYVVKSLSNKKCDCSNNNFILVTYSNNIILLHQY